WMGDPAKADPSRIEDFHWLDDAKWRYGGNYLHVDANYLLLVENLLDTTHLPVLHTTSLGAGARQLSERGSRWMNMWNLNAITPETEKTAHYFFAQAFNFKLDQKWAADMLAVQIRDIFLEDMAMVKAQQVNMDLGPSSVVNLGQDKAWVA